MIIKYIGPLSKVEFGGFGSFKRGEEVEVDEDFGRKLLDLGAFKVIIDEHEEDYYYDHNNNEEVALEDEVEGEEEDKEEEE